MPEKVRVCIIGAGTAGLCAAKNAAEHGMDPVVFEQSVSIGGTWAYKEKITHDAFGHDVCSSLYEGLRTNLPKEVMGFPDFSYPSHIFDSYIGAQDVWNFLRSYTKHFRLMQYIKLMHYVVRVRPHRGGWQIIVKDLKNDCLKTHYFDFVLVCNGHYSTPIKPNIENSDHFEGLQIHSHNFRRAKDFKDRNVLMIGAGASGLDIAMHIHATARSVILSHHLKTSPNTNFLPRLVQKPDVMRFTHDGVIFIDGSTTQCDCVIYCTGYKYTFPFLSVDSGIYVEDNHVQPLYKHCIDIAHPTMALIGLPFRVSSTHLVDIQLRFVLKYYSNQKILPSREQMTMDTNMDMSTRWARGLRKREAHLMDKELFAYQKDLSETANIKNMLPAVQNILRQFVDFQSTIDLETFRNALYRIIDDNVFVRLN